SGPYGWVSVARKKCRIEGVRPMPGARSKFAWAFAGVIVGALCGTSTLLYPHISPLRSASGAPPADTPIPQEPADEELIVPVKTIHPKRDRAFTVTSQQLATVEAYYQADLRARASGVVKYIPKDVGAKVTRGELLIELDVPDMRQEVYLKEAVV